MTDRYKIDKTCSLSQEQYDLIVNYLKTGVKPSGYDIRQSGFEGNLDLVWKKGPLSRFKAIVKRMKIRQSDNSLIFYTNSKIVIPNTKFVDVIREAHESQGFKHLNMTKTMEKLNEKYCMGSRQFGICEETVREVVRTCKHGSCAKYSWKKQKTTDTSATEQQNDEPNQDTIDIDNAGVQTQVLNTDQFLQTFPRVTPIPRFDKLIAIPCVFPVPVSSHQPRLKLMFTGPLPTTLPATITLPTIAPTASSSSTHLSGLSATNTSNVIKILPKPVTTATPSLLQLLTQPTAGASSQMINLGVMPNSLPNQGNRTMDSSPSDENIPQSESLTQLAQIGGTFSLVQAGYPLDINNNNVLEDSHVMQLDSEGKGTNEEKLSSQTNSFHGSTNQITSNRPLNSMMYPHLWHNLKEIQEEEDQYKQLIIAIQDLRADILVAMTEEHSHAVDNIKKKILVLELMIQNAKMSTKALMSDGDDKFLNSLSPSSAFEDI